MALINIKFKEYVRKGDLSLDYCDLIMPCTGEVCGDSPNMFWDPMKRYSFIECPDCGKCTEFFDTMDEAISQWNDLN